MLSRFIFLLSIYDTSAVYRISQASLVRDRIANGVSPAMRTRIAAKMPQMESQIQAPLLSVTITSAFLGFQRSKTYQNGTWSGHDLTHHFHDDRAPISYSSVSRGVQQNRHLQLFAAPPLPQQTLQPAHLRAREPAGSPAPPQPHQLLLTCPIALLQKRRSYLQFKPWQLTLTIPTSCALWNSTVLVCEPSHCLTSRYLTFLPTLPAQIPQCHMQTFSQINLVTPITVPLNAVVLLPAPPLLSKSGKERRPASRKRNEGSSARTMSPAPKNVRSSPSNNPPPDKKASEPTETSGVGSIRAANSTTTTPGANSTTTIILANLSLSTSNTSLAIVMSAPIFLRWVPMYNGSTANREENYVRVSRREGEEYSTHRHST